MTPAAGRAFRAVPASAPVVSLAGLLLSVLIIGIVLRVPMSG